MSRLGFLSVPIVVVVSAVSADAGIFRKSRPNPAQAVPELIKTLQSDPDESKRSDAAEELKEFDPKAFPDLIPALIAALQKDPSSSVRSDAASTLGKLRPVNQQAGFALEQALDNDSSIRVRMSARSALWQYTLLGYRSGKNEEPKQEQTGEPPLAPPQGASAARGGNAPAPKPAPVVAPVRQAAPRTQTQEPPLAAPVATPEPPLSNSAPRQAAPVVVTPARPKVEFPKVSLPKFEPAPAEEEGPSLNPPK